MRRLKRYCFLWMLLFSSIACAVNFEDDLQVGWEVMWDERGTPRQLMKWDNKLGNVYTYKITGNHSSADRTQIEKILNATTTLTGLNFKEELMQAVDVPIEFKFVSDSELGDSVGCAAQALKWNNYKLEKAWIRLKNRSAYTCIAHEIMHLLGLPGHPEGKTVLTYFPWRRDVFMRLDEVMLKTIYSTDTPAGATPFKVLQTYSKLLQADNNYNLTAAQYEAVEQAFFSKKVLEMERFAQGTGEVPQIVIRSGRSQQGFIRNAKVTMIHYLGMAYRDAVLVKRDLKQAVQWWQSSAMKGYSNSQVLLAFAYLNGNGVEVNKVEAAKWFGIAANSNNSIGIKQYAVVMSTLDSETQTIVKNQVSAFKTDENY
jgi:hypothetical protein